jgi:hypothetical protein
MNLSTSNKSLDEQQKSLFSDRIDSTLGEKMKSYLLNKAAYVTEEKLPNPTCNQRKKIENVSK